MKCREVYGKELVMAVKRGDDGGWISKGGLEECTEVLKCK